jgi:hypothetical protein
MLAKYARLAAQTAMLALMQTPVPLVKLVITLIAAYARLAAQDAKLALVEPPVPPVQLVSRSRGTTIACAIRRRRLESLIQSYSFYI